VRQILFNGASICDIGGRLSKHYNCDAEEWIIPPIDFEEKCPNLHCLFYKLQSEQFNNVYCKMLQTEFDGNSSVDLHLEFAELFAADGSTSVRVNDGPYPSLTITINKYDCENDHQIELLKTYFHEIMHAHMKKAVYDAFGPASTPDNYLDLFDEATKVNWKYNASSINQIEHEILANTMIEDLAKSLQQFFWK